MKHLHCGLERILDHRDDVCIGAVGEDDRVSLECTSKCADPVSQSAGLLVCLCRGCRLHLAFQIPDESIGLAGHEGAEVVDN